MFFFPLILQKLRPPKKVIAPKEAWGVDNLDDNGYQYTANGNNTLQEPGTIYSEKTRKYEDAKPHYQSGVQYFCHVQPVIMQLTMWSTLSVCLKDLSTQQIILELRYLTNFESL